jgi:hypothetical protein
MVHFQRALDPLFQESFKIFAGQDLFELLHPVRFDSPVGASTATEAGFDLVPFDLAFHVAQELLAT